MTKYALTDVTGIFGGNAVKELVKLVAPTDVIALTQKVEKARSTVPEGVEVRFADYDDPEQLKDALKGVDRLLLVATHTSEKMLRIYQQKNVIKAATAAGVKFIAYTSFPHADTNKADIAADRRQIEQMIIDSGIDYSFLRNNWYLEDEATILKAAIEDGIFVYASNIGKVGWALEDEYSEAAAKALAMKKPKKVYELSGPLRSYRELSKYIEEDFELSPVDFEEYEDYLVDKGLSEAIVRALVLSQRAIHDGQLNEETTDLIDLLGHDLMPIPEAIKKVISEPRT
jgi:Predicted nucleoside-diphosphate-sugar epimerases